MLYNRHFSRSSGQLNTYKHHQYINDSLKNKGISRSVQDLSTSWIVVDKGSAQIQNSASTSSLNKNTNNATTGNSLSASKNNPAHLSSPILYSPSLDHGIYSKLFGSTDKSNNNRVGRGIGSIRKKSYFLNTSPSMDNIKAFPETGTSYETGIPTLETTIENNGFDKLNPNDNPPSPTLSIKSSLSATNLLSNEIFGRNNNIDNNREKVSTITAGIASAVATTTTLNDLPSKISLKTQYKKKEVHDKPSGKLLFIYLFIYFYIHDNIVYKYH